MGDGGPETEEPLLSGVSRWAILVSNQWPLPCEGSSATTLSPDDGGNCGSVPSKGELRSEWFRLPEERAAEIAARTLALPDAQSVEDLTALLTSAGER